MKVRLLHYRELILKISEEHHGYYSLEFHVRLISYKDMKYVHMLIRKVKERVAVAPRLKSTLSETLTEQGARLMALGSTTPRRASYFYKT